MRETDKTFISTVLATNWIKPNVLKSSKPISWYKKNEEIGLCRSAIRYVSPVDSKFLQTRYIYASLLFVSSITGLQCICISSQ